MAGLPNFGNAFGGHGSGGLSNDQIYLYRHAERWLAANRHMLGKNQHVELADPVSTHSGISCKLIKVAEGGRQLLDLFKAYDARCSDVRDTRDDETGTNAYRVDIPFPEGGPTGETFQRNYVPSPWSSFVDEPKFLIIAFAATCVSAALTTRADQWMSLAAFVLGKL